MSAAQPRPFIGLLGYVTPPVYRAFFHSLFAALREQGDSARVAAAKAHAALAAAIASGTLPRAPGGCPR